MLKAKDVFSFDNPTYAPLRDGSRKVIQAYQNANRFFDAAQEYVYIEEGMPFLSKFIHKRAHTFPKKFDSFAEMLHERHLMAEYPATPELDWREELKAIDDVFYLLIRVHEDINEALEEFRNMTDNAIFRAMSLFSEELMLQNSREYTKILELWFRWDNDGGSKTSFDSWCEKILDEEDDEE